MVTKRRKYNASSLDTALEEFFFFFLFFFSRVSHREKEEKQMTEITIDSL